MTRVCTVSHDISIMMFRINTAETLSAARRSRASADLDHAASQHIKEPNDRCMLIVNRGVPGLVDRVFAVHAGSRRFDSHRRQMSERFFRSKRPRYPHPVCSELEIVVSEWPSVIAVSLNIGGGVRLINQQNCTTRTDARRRVCATMVPYCWATRGTSLRELDYIQTHSACWFISFGWDNYSKIKFYDH